MAQSGPALTVVFDTMVLAYALLGVEPYREDAVRALELADVVAAPDSCGAELTNVVWQWIRSRGLTLEAGLEALRDAEALLEHVESTAVLWADALVLAVERDHPAYDTLFVALASRTGTKVVTQDARMLERFPEYTITPRAFCEAEERQAEAEFEADSSEAETDTEQGSAPSPTEE